MLAMPHKGSKKNSPSGIILKGYDPLRNIKVILGFSIFILGQDKGYTVVYIPCLNVIRKSLISLCYC